MDLLHIVLTIIFVGFAASVLSDVLPLKPVFKNMIYLVTVIWLVYLIAGWAGVSIPR